MDVNLIKELESVVGRGVTGEEMKEVKDAMRMEMMTGFRGLDPGQPYDYITRRADYQVGLFGSGKVTRHHRPIAVENYRREQERPNREARD